MESLPIETVQQILSNLITARDISTCNCVSKRWKESVPYIPTLFFPRSFFSGSNSPESNAIIGRMISSAVILSKLIIYCPVSFTNLSSWLTLKSKSLRSLDLRLDSITSKKYDIEEDATRKLDCIDCVKDLESLKLWGVCLHNSPKWSCFERLLSLEIIGANLREKSLMDALKACPNLTNLALIGCDGVVRVDINLPRLETCRLDFLGHMNLSLDIKSQNLQQLSISGFSWIHVYHNNCLRTVSISKASGSVYMVDIGKVECLEYLSVRGVQWSWKALDSVLKTASNVKCLIMKVEFCGEDNLMPFPPVDLVDFFNNHPKLQSFEIHGAMFAALSQKDNLGDLHSSFKIPNLKQIAITVRSPLNAEQKLNTLESLLKCSKNIQKMVIRVSQMRTFQDIADDFFEDIWKFANMNKKIVFIE
ncbi:F-box protein-like [Zostera marina]|uniref:F-box protein-like n=1 Tax=Zostera marina TaxID=29655 RepID=A0A0K9PFK6_ZOSMR|nr:F-box protein-like [Zostera marina]